jgi:hypothetical protein
MQPCCPLACQNCTNQVQKGQFQMALSPVISLEELIEIRNFVHFSLASHLVHLAFIRVPLATRFFRHLLHVQIGETSRRPVPQKEHRHHPQAGGAPNYSCP